MRRLVVAALVSALSIAAAGCGDSRPEHRLSSRSTEKPWAPPTPPLSPPPTPLLVDYVPKPVNHKGHPVCGFYTVKDTVGSTKVTLLKLGIAVIPDPPLSDPNHSRADLAALYTYDIPSGKVVSATVTFDGTGAVSNGGEYSPPGASFFYVSLDIDILELNARYLSRTTTVTVTVDSKKAVVETDESNNTLTLRVRPTKGGALKISDNECTVVR
jgi:hypothetical protein